MTSLSYFDRENIDKGKFFFPCKNQHSQSFQTIQFDEDLGRYFDHFVVRQNTARKKNDN